MIAIKNWPRAVCALAVLGLAAGTPQVARAQQGGDASRTLKVKLKYSGAGTVDGKRQIFVFLFDSPGFMQSPENAMPIGRETASSKNATVTFSDLASSPVYLVAVFDPTGAYDGMSAPRSGSCVSIYGSTPSQPEPIKIEPGKTVEMELAFDDSVKMP